MARLRIKTGFKIIRQFHWLIPLVMAMPSFVLAQSSGNKILILSSNDPEFQMGRYPLENYLSILTDSIGELTIEEVTDPAIDKQFQVGKLAPLFSDQPNIAYFWAKLSIQAQVEKNEKWLLIMGGAEILMFESQDGKWTSNKKTGFQLPLSQRYFKENYGVMPALPIYLNPGQTTTYYFKIKPGENLSIPYWQNLNGTLSSPDHVAQSERKSRGFLLLIDGIPQEQFPYIFDRFYQVDDSAIRQGEGTGLGLALVKELVQLMEGEIRVESEPGKGSRFILLLPVRRRAERKDIEMTIDQNQSIITTSPTKVSSALKKQLHSNLPLVLVVEDNMDVIYYLRKCLKEQYQVIEAQNGQEGIEMAIETIPDLVVSDVMMPKVDGFQLCKTLKTDERTSHIPIVLLTAKVTQEDKLQGLTHGADAYLTKPFQKEELLVRLENLIELRRKLQIHYQNANGQSTEPEDIFMKKVWNIVQANLDNADYSVVDLSRDLGMSRAQVHRKLKALTDLSAIQYFRLIRLNKAQELLKNTEQPIAEIGYAVGFKDPSHFTRVFTRHFGVNPRDMRK